MGDLCARGWHECLCWSDARNVLEDLGYVAPWGEVVCGACVVVNGGRGNEFRKRGNARG